MDFGRRSWLIAQKAKYLTMPILCNSLHHMKLANYELYIIPIMANLAEKTAHQASVTLHALDENEVVIIYCIMIFFWVF